MYLYADRIILQILAFSLGPFLGLLTAAFVNPWAGIIIGLTAFIFIFFQPFFSDCCLKNTAKDLGLEKILLAEGNVKYYSRSLDLTGKLYLCRDKITFVINNKVDIILPVEKILKVQGETEQIDEEALKLTPMFERRSPNLPQVTQMVTEIAVLNCGILQITVEQSIFSNEFCFEVSDINLWVKKVIELQKSRAL
ncbi:MAG: hypothetical protein JM58_16710 [Peptococcaceae bacterium BICA1-8]|nr:MAG: hypothetical protein JM58_16710 [Peptococcaceae bacterium BICA1-8]